MNNKLLYVDFLRGVAILMVIATHLKGIVPNCHSITNAILSFSTMGVQLFFVVSALTLYLSWSNRKNEFNPIRNFYLRRYFRIAPLYYVGIILYFIVATVKTYLNTQIISWPEQYTLSGIITNTLLIHGLYPPGNNNIVPGGWSIGTEFLFYLIFPLIIKWLLQPNMRFWILFVTLCLSVIPSIHITAYHYNNVISMSDYFYRSIINQLPIFLVSLSAIHFQMLGLKIKTWTATIVLLLTLVLLFMFWNSENVITTSLITLIAGLFFTSATILSSKIPITYYQKSLYPVCLIGKLSYSMYIMHFLVLDIVRNFSDHFLLNYKEISLAVVFLTSVLATAIIAFFTEKFIESKGINLGKIIIKKTS